ncbi:hypothetical protein H650_24045 [Enterobacter sp. R4-368]|nr:hypothetical protein H650_24045 [Enterobacter sp. R4-368]
MYAINSTAERIVFRDVPVSLLRRKQAVNSPLAIAFYVVSQGIIDKY